MSSASDIKEYDDWMKKIALAGVDLQKVYRDFAERLSVVEELPAESVVAFAKLNTSDKIIFHFSGKALIDSVRNKCRDLFSENVAYALTVAANLPKKVNDSVEDQYAAALKNWPEATENSYVGCAEKKILGTVADLRKIKSTITIAQHSLAAFRF